MRTFNPPYSSCHWPCAVDWNGQPIPRPSFSSRSGAVIAFARYSSELGLGPIFPELRLGSIFPELRLGSIFPELRLGPSSLSCSWDPSSLSCGWSPSSPALHLAQVGSLRARPRQAWALSHASCISRVQFSRKSIGCGLGREEELGVAKQERQGHPLLGPQCGVNLLNNLHVKSGKGFLSCPHAP